MNFFARRRYRKVIHHLVHEGRHLVNMRGDILPPASLEELAARERDLLAAWAQRDEKMILKEIEVFSAWLEKLNPPRTHPKLREYVEVVVVAVAVAMAFRTYFIQPFKIPTGSMQPTLYGITVQTQYAPTLMDRFPLNIVPWILFGEHYSEVKAKVAGRVDPRYLTEDESIVFFVNGIPHPILRDMTLFFSLGDYVAKGQVMASGRVRHGDHIFVDKLRYNFCRPKRGDISVFGTDNIHYPRIRPNSFYIKRLVGLPGEEVAVQPPYLVINGQRVTEPYPFKRLLEEKDKGYVGYTMAREQPDAEVYLGKNGSPRKLGKEQFLMLGDNTENSYDGRYFGPIRQEDLVGPAFMVYWPITKRWGRTR